MSVTFKEQEMQVYKLAAWMEQILSTENPSEKEREWLDKLGEIQNRIQKRKFRMAVVGEFNRGKSSFINALLGKKILPEDILAATATVNRITYGSEPKAYVIWKDGNVCDTSVPVDDLAAYVTKLTDASAANAGKIKEAVVEYPSLLCLNDVDIIDTPGMNDEDDMNLVTVEQLENIDLAIVAIHASYPFSDTESRFVKQLLESSQICQILFVVTHIDEIRQREREKLISYLKKRIREKVLDGLNGEYEAGHVIYQKYHDIFDNIRIFPVSSPEALTALAMNDMDMYKNSGFAALNEELPRLIFNVQSGSMILNIIQNIQQIIAEYRKLLSDSVISDRDADELMKLCKEEGIRIRDHLWEKAVSQVERTIPLTENEKNNIQTAFLQALGQVREFSHAQIQNALVPVLCEQYHTINTALKRRYDCCLLKEKEDIRMKLLDAQNKFFQLLSPWRLISKKMHREIENLAKLEMEIADNAEMEKFYWLYPPADVIVRVPVNQSVVPVIRRVIDESAEDYRRRELKRQKTIFTERYYAANNMLYQFLVMLKHEIDICRKYDPSSDSRMSRIEDMEKQCSSLRKSILDMKMQNETAK